MNISEFKNARKGRTWQDVADLFGVPLMRMFRWNREGHQIKRMNGRLAIVKVLAEAQEQEQESA